MKQDVTMFVDHLTVIDFSFLDMERGLMGESWIVDIELTGALDEAGMIFDFSHVKKLLKQHIDLAVDHQLLLPVQHPNVRIEDKGDQYEVHATYGNDTLFYHRSPKQAVAVIDHRSVSQTAVAQHLEAVLKTVLPSNVLALKLQLRNEPLPGAYFQYSHGLKQHDGNCQRIAHGHRSQLYLYRNDERDQALEAEWCQRWWGVYLMKREDLVAEEVHAGKTYYRTQYTARQGTFELLIEADRCEMTEETSTIEHIAEFVAYKIAAKCPGDEIRAKVFEGIDKGAIATVGQ